MVDPNNITNYNLNDYQLQEVLLFWVCVAGKTASVISKRLDIVLNNIGCSVNKLPFDVIKKLDKEELGIILKNNGIGCYNLKAQAIKELADSNLDLRLCGVEDLENITGIGMKTSRCFIIHSRRNAPYAGLDTHILKHLSYKGYDVPKSTPSKKKYLELEKIFINMALSLGKTVAEYDLEIWNTYSKKIKKLLDK
jgi:thermostable 8-oxoguanine DNA glycosylase